MHSAQIKMTTKNNCYTKENGAVDVVVSICRLLNHNFLKGIKGVGLSKVNRLFGNKITIG